MIITSSGEDSQLLNNQIKIQLGLLKVELTNEQQCFVIKLADYQEGATYSRCFVKSEPLDNSNKLQPEDIILAFKECYEALGKETPRDYIYGSDIHGVTSYLKIDVQGVMEVFVRCTKGQKVFYEKLQMRLDHRQDMPVRMLLDYFVSRQKIISEVSIQSIRKQQEERARVIKVEFENRLEQMARLQAEKIASLNQQIATLKQKQKPLEERLNKMVAKYIEVSRLLSVYKYLLPQQLINLVSPRNRRDSESDEQNLDELGNQAPSQSFQTSEDLFGRVKQIIRTTFQQLDIAQYMGGQHRLSTVDPSNFDSDSMLGQQKNVSFDDQSPYISWFCVQGNSVTYQGSPGFFNFIGSWCQIMVNQVIPKDRIYKFSVKIVQTQRRAIMIGITDRLKQRQNRSPDQKNSIGYYGRWGKIFPSNYQSGKGFCQQQTVTVKVNLKLMTIKWSVHNESRAKVMYQTLGESNREFVPYIQMRHIGDRIEWRGSSIHP